MQVKKFCYQKIVFAALWLFIGLFALEYFYIGYNGDKIWLWYAAQEWLSGKVLYLDIFESNPPLIIYWNALPVELHNYFPAFQTYQYSTLILLIAIAISTFFASRILKQHSIISSPRYYSLTVALYAFLLIVLTNPLAFADREHIFTVLALPMLLLGLPNIDSHKISVKLRFSIGLFSVIGFCIKPQIAIIWLFGKLYRLFATRNIRASLFQVEDISLYLFGIIYVAATYLYFPNYFHTILPMLVESYAKFNSPKTKLLGILWFLMCTSAIFVDFRLRMKTVIHNDLPYLVTLLFSAFLYVLMNNGWLYTFWPLDALMTITTYWMWIGYLEKSDTSVSADIKKIRFGRNACLLFFFVTAILAVTIKMAGIFTSFAEINMLSEGDYKVEQEILNLNPVEDNYFAALDLEFSNWFTIADLTQKKWGIRFNHLWMLPYLYEKYGYSKKIQENWIFKYVSRALIEDLSKNKVSTLFILRSSKHYNIDMLRLFSSSPEFSSELLKYKKIKTFSECRDAAQKSCKVYDVYQRNNTP